MNCEQCENHLYDLHEGKLGPDLSLQVNRHLESCDECSALLQDIWNMSLAASRWQQQSVPRWEQNKTFFPRQRWQFPQMLATAASILALMMVLTDTRIVTTDGGISITSGDRHYVSADQFQAFAASQQDNLEQLASQQAASDQLVMRTMLEASREERREDLTTLASYMNATQIRQTRVMEENLRYLLASQAEDERDIQQLSQAFQQSLSRGSDM